MAKKNGWNKISECLPEKGQQVLLITVNRFWNTPEGIKDMNVTATGYLQSYGIHTFWSVFGESGKEINTFTHWMAIDSPED